MHYHRCHASSIGCFRRAAIQCSRREIAFDSFGSPYVRNGMRQWKQMNRNPINNAKIYLTTKTTNSSSTDIMDRSTLINQSDITPIPADSDSERPNRKALPTISRTKAYLELGKARLSALVVTTTAAGFIAAGPVALSDPTVLVAALTGTALCSASAAAVNQIMEVERDRKMKRTQPRPLVTGALSMPQATAAAASWGGLGPLILWYGTDPLTASLGAFNMFLYTCIYTPMKPVTVVNTWVGAVVGAIPPVMGFTAASAVIAQSQLSSAMNAGPVLSPLTDWAVVLLDPIAMTLGATLYLWQLPHFMALSYMYRADYMRGGFVMIPTAYTTTPADDDNVVTEAEDATAIQTANVIVRYAWYLSMVPVAASLLDITSSMYAMEGLLLNAYALRAAYRFHGHRSNQNARHIFLTSLWYLPCTLMLFLLHSKTWDVTAENKTPNGLSQCLSDAIHSIRVKGREICAHEHAVVTQSNARQACPVVVGTEHSVETVQQASQALTEVADASTNQKFASNQEKI